MYPDFDQLNILGSVIVFYSVYEFIAKGGLNRGKRTKHMNAAAEQNQNSVVKRTSVNYSIVFRHTRLVFII